MTGDHQRGGMYESGKESCPVGGYHVSDVERLGSLIRSIFAMLDIYTVYTPRVSSVTSLYYHYIFGPHTYIHIYIHTYIHTYIHSIP
jgi:hypothetical protein